MRKNILPMYGAAIVLGILTGTLGSSFILAIRSIDAYLGRGLMWVNAHGGHTGLVSAAVSMLMVCIAWLLVKWIAPEAGGSGVQEIEGSLLHTRGIFWRRLLPVKFLGGVLAISAKMVLGREGPTIQMGGNLGDMVGERFGFTSKQRDALIAAGAAAGLATAFNAPLAGVLFVLEEMRNQFDFSFTNFKTVAICCVIATVVLHIMVGSQAAIPMAVFSLPSLKSLWLFFIFGIVMGFVGWLFNALLMKSLYKMDQLSDRMRFGYVMFLGLAVGYLAAFYPTVVGGGYEIIEQSLTMTPTLLTLFVLIIVRFMLTLLCYNTGVPGGIFAPILALGTLLGLAASSFFQWMMVDMSVHPGMFAVAGMGALFSAAVRAPITGIILVVEMTQNYALILPLMVTCLTSTTVMQLAGNPPIYTQLLQRVLAREGRKEGV